MATRSVLITSADQYMGPAIAGKFSELGMAVLRDNEKFLDHVRRNVPTGKVGAAEETAELAAYLASERCNHMAGQIIPLAGGWAT